MMAPAEDEGQLTSALVRLVLGNDWVDRRTERIKILDDARVERTLSVEFTLPQVDLPRPAADASFPLPIAIFKSGLLHGFTVTGQDHERVTAVTRSENRQYAEDIVMTTAEMVFQSDRLDIETHGLLSDTLSERKPEAAYALARFQGASRGSPLANLWQDDFARALLSDLEGQFVLFVRVAYVAGDHRAIELKWEEDIHPHGLHLPLISGRDFALILPDIGSSRSYHAEIEAPPDVLFAYGPRAPVQGSNPLLVVRPRHVYVYASDKPRGTFAVLTWRFKLDRDGLLRTALWVSLCTTAALIGGAVLRVLGFAPSGPTATVLVALIAVFATYLVRPGEHRLVKRVAARVTIPIFLSAVLSYLAAASLFVNFPFWLNLAAGSLLATNLPWLGSSVARIHAGARFLLWVILGVVSLAVLLYLVFFVFLAIGDRRKNVEIAPSAKKVRSTADAIDELGRPFRGWYTEGAMGTPSQIGQRLPREIEVFAHQLNEWTRLRPKGWERPSRLAASPQGSESGSLAYKRPPWFRRLMSLIDRVSLALGMKPTDLWLLRVSDPGTQDKLRVPVFLVQVAGSRYLVSPYGRTRPVMALQASRECEFVRGTKVFGSRETLALKAIELADADKPPVLRAYARLWLSHFKKQFDVHENAPDNELLSKAAYYPVFRLVSPRHTTVRVHYDAGWGNAIWVRGEEPLSWTVGSRMENSGGNVWVFEFEPSAGTKVAQLKPLINDCTWSARSNDTADVGTMLDLRPNFHQAGTTTIRVHRDVGWGNRITIRGDAPPLNWIAGETTVWSQGNVWTWETARIPLGEQFEFKPLINDTSYSLGTNYVCVGGTTIDIYPIYRRGEIDRRATTIRVRGRASRMNIAGSLEPLLWSRVQAMRPRESDIWVWETTDLPVGARFDFKVVRNGVDWSQGSNFAGRGGQVVEVYPTF